MISKKKNNFFTLDFIILLSTLTLITTGICFIYSSGMTSSGIQSSNEFIKQIVWSVIGLIIMTLIYIGNYKRYSHLNIYLYIVGLALLIGVLIVGKKVNGAKSWLGIGPFGIQPSELMKIGVILFLSSFLDKHKKDIKSLKVFVQSFLIVVVPIVLIFLQPDMGTVLVYLPIFFFMSFIAGARLKHLFFVILLGFLTVIITVLPFWEKIIVQKNVFFVDVITNNLYYGIVLTTLIIVLLLSLLGYFIFNKKYYYWMTYSSLITFLAFVFGKIASKVLHGYQIQRLIIFLDPYVDDRGSGYHILQSLIAVGSGGVNGKGFLKGDFGHGRFLPQRSTDFIYSVIGEETGFIGCVLLLVVFAILLIRCIYIISSIEDIQGRTIIAGVAGMIFFHVLVNVGMTIGVMPITGIPLLFISYGGSSLLTSMIGIGLVLNVNKENLGYK